MNMNHEYGDNKNVYVQSQQFGLLGKTFMLTSFLFVVVAALIYVIMKYMPVQAYNPLGFIFLPIIAIVASFFIFFAMSKNIHRPVWINCIYLVVYTTIEVVFFGFLFWILNQVTYDNYLLDKIPFVFLLTACISFVVGFLGYTMRNKTAMKLGKMIWIGIFSWIILSLVFSIAIYFLTGVTYKWLIFVYCFLGGALTMGTIAFQVYQIKRTQEFLAISGEYSTRVINNMAIFYSALLLDSLLNLVWYIARILVALGRD